MLPTITKLQFNYIKGLADKKNWTVQLDGSLCRIVKEVLRYPIDQPVENLLVPRKKASATIDGLLKCADTAAALKVPAAPTSTSNAQLTPWQSLQATLTKIPASKYVVEVNPGQFWFFEIVQRKDGARYLNRLHGAPGTWKREFLPVGQQNIWALKIAANPTAAAIKYAEIYTRCAACDSPLTNGKSIAEAMGPVCRKKFNL